MTNQDFEILWDKVHQYLTDVRRNKSQEYSPDVDVLQNFKRCAALENTYPAKALLGKVSKHIVALFDFVNDMNEKDIPMSQWTEKVGDIIVYMNLLYALVLEHKNIDAKDIKIGD